MIRGVARLNYAPLGATGDKMVRFVGKCSTGLVDNKSFEPERGPWAQVVAGQWERVMVSLQGRDASDKIADN
jgi:hypothetical protein